MNSKKNNIHPSLDSLDVNSTFSLIKKLQTDSGFRQQMRLFYLEGVRNFLRAVTHRYDISCIYYSKHLLSTVSARQTIRRLKRTGVPSFNVSPEQFRSISSNNRASGIGAIATIPHHSLHKTPLRSGLCWIVLDNIRSAGNFGTLIRTSEAAGSAGFLLLNRQIDPYSPETLRASMGSIFSQRFIYSSREQFIHWINRHKATLIGATTNAAIDYQRFNYPASPLIFLGEERKGLSDDQKHLCHYQVRIPMAGDCDSLNLGVAGSLILYEVMRRNSR